SRHSRQAVGRRKLALILLIEELSSSDYVDRNAGILRDFARVAIINLAKGIDAGGDQDYCASPTLHTHQTREISLLLFGILEHDRIAPSAYESKFKRVKKIRLAKGRRASQ